jgi:hypothetical protein
MQVRDVRNHCKVQIPLSRGPLGGVVTGCARAKGPGLCGTSENTPTRTFVNKGKKKEGPVLLRDWPLALMTERYTKGGSYFAVLLPV